MAVKTDTEVIIGGKVFTLSGYESEEYLQKVASYLNNKISEYNGDENFKRLPIDTQSVLIELNIADDYFKAQAEKEELQKKAEELEKELYAARHDIVSTKLKLENSLKQQDVIESRAMEWKEKYQSLAGSMGGDF